MQIADASTRRRIISLVPAWGGLMGYHFRLLGLALLVALMPWFSLTSGGTLPPIQASSGIIQLDPTLPIHPYLQYGASVEPTRRVRVIVQKTSSLVSSHLIAQSVGAPIVEEFPFIQSLVLEARLQSVLLLASLPGVRYVSYDAPVLTTFVNTRNLRTTHQDTIGVPAVWNGDQRPATGAGVTIAVLDTGVDPDHPDFRSNVTAESVTGDDGRDGHGHGTHVIGILAGKDPQGRYLGVAPDARVISVRIADNQGIGSESSLLRGLQWVYEHRAAEGIRVVNLSVSTGFPALSVTSPVTAAVEQLWRGGVVVVASAGNRGHDAGAVWFPPGNNPFIITVGALDHNETIEPTDDQLASFSSRGRTQTGHLKPDVVAPGQRIVAPLASGNVVLAQQYPDRVIDARYLRLSGTSMAAPIVSGVIALLLEQHPSLSPDQVKWLLMGTARAYSGQPHPAGVVDAAQAMLVAATDSIGVANTGLQPSLLLALPTGSTEWDQAYWDQAYWDQVYWDETRSD